MDPLAKRVSSTLLYPYHTKQVLTNVLENVAKRAQTVCERSGRSVNVLRSVYELHGRAG